MERKWRTRHILGRIPIETIKTETITLYLASLFPHFPFLKYEKNKAINQEVQAEIHMSPTTFKSIALWMMKNVEKYEEVFGEIKAEPKNKSMKSESEEYVK